MSAAALTPRVRVLLVCDEAVPSDTEEAVFHLQGVRQYHRAGASSFGAPLSLFLLLSCPRPGDYPGWTRLIQESTERILRYVEFNAGFEEENELVLAVDLGTWPLLQPGQYRFEVWFSIPGAGDALKGECPFRILPTEE